MEIDAVTFTSSSTVTNFVESIGPESARLLEHTLVVSIGPITSETARDAGIRVDLEAEDHSIPGLIGVLKRRFTSES
jgi:uroporphyrinogen-III synthase